MKTRIKIVKIPLNTDRASAFGLVFKLQFYFPDPDRPEITVFLDNELTRSQDWAIYGVRSERPDLFRNVAFSGLGEPRAFELGSEFRIEFASLTQEEVVYARTGKTLEPAYHFEVEPLHVH